MPEIDVANDPRRKRYEARLAGEVAGFTEYMLTDELIVFTHTEVSPRFEGHGVGSAIARFALDDVRAAGERKVLPVCPFIKGWIRRHREYEPIVYGVPATTTGD
ncbi:GNAT family N-acetyltransferase [Nocardioides pantholopis]|uniref:GNAT family N-acetyltransferase n=1 Tax=Nocardioides pantholopis TaxID=2483798 RepID=UPI000F07A366|nr:GNAT family N-acetyltransferase [Nocardioides pantholopis]